MQGRGVEGATAGWGAGGRFGHPGGTHCLLRIHYVSACHLHQAVFPASPERWREPAPLRGRGTWVSDRVRALRRRESRVPSQCDLKPRLPETDLSPACGTGAAWAGGVPSGEGDATRHPHWEVPVGGGSAWDLRSLWPPAPAPAPWASRGPGWESCAGKKLLTCPSNLCALSMPVCPSRVQTRQRSQGVWGGADNICSASPSGRDK